MSQVLSVERYGKSYGGFEAVVDLSFELAAGEVLGLCGPNGAGKTTTLRAIAGMIVPSTGRIIVAGRDVQADPVEAKRALAFVPDEPALFDHLTVQEHLVLMSKLYGVQDGAERARALLAELEIADKADELASALSRGMKQKLSLACALIHAPRLLLLDEPLTGLDPVAIRRTKDRILRCASEGAAVVLSSHLLSLVDEMCDRVLFLKKGRRVFLGSHDEIVAARPDLASRSLEDVFLELTADAPPAP